MSGVQQIYDQKSRKDKELSESTPRIQMYELKRCYVSKSRNQQHISRILTNSSSIVFASAFLRRLCCGALLAESCRVVVVTAGQTFNALAHLLYW